jgi:hypothetical protein
VLEKKLSPLRLVSHAALYGAGFSRVFYDKNTNMVYK